MQASLRPEIEFLRSSKTLLDDFRRVCRLRGIPTWIPGASPALGLVDYIHFISFLQVERCPAWIVVWFVEPVLRSDSVFLLNYARDWMEGIRQESLRSRFVLAHG